GATFSETTRDVRPIRRNGINKAAVRRVARRLDRAPRAPDEDLHSTPPSAENRRRSRRSFRGGAARSGTDGPPRVRARIRIRRVGGAGPARRPLGAGRALLAPPRPP